MAELTTLPAIDPLLFHADDELLLTRLHSRCAKRVFMKGFQPCGARQVRVNMSPSLVREAAARGVALKSGDVVCCNPNTECGALTGLRLRALLEILQ